MRHVPGLLPEVAHQAAPAAGFAAAPEPAGGYPVRFVSAPVSPVMRVFPADDRSGPVVGVDVYSGSAWPAYPPPAPWVQNVVASMRSMAVGLSLDPDDLGRWFDELEPLPALMSRTFELDRPAGELDGVE